MRARAGLLLVGGLLIAAAAPGAADTGRDPDAASAARVVAMIGSDLAPHPRLLLPPGGIEELKRLSSSDPVSSRAEELLLGRANRLAGLDPLPREMEGKRLLSVSREYLRRIATFGLAWLLTGEERYLARGKAEMLAAAEFRDWNPSHFLDVAEMTAALALGYDWFQPELEEKERRIIREAIVTKGLEPSFSGDLWWVRGTNNWNPVCHGGLILGALAVAENEPDLAAKIIARAVSSLPVAMAQYEPDGAYPEGPGYWSYGTTYNVMAIAALESALGTDFGLASRPGFAGSARYMLHATAPTGEFFNYSDCVPNDSIEPALAWFAARLGDSSLEWFQRDRIMKMPDLRDSDPLPHADAERYALPQLVLWHRPGPARSPEELGWVGRGQTPVAMFRSGWDPGACYVGIKGGSPSAPHAHMDAGSFIYEADGVRWAVDLGMQDYNGLEQAGIQLFYMGQDSGRWDVFRLGWRSHSVLSFGGSPQDVGGSATITAEGVDGPSPVVEVDCSPVYPGHAAAVKRRFRFESRRSLRIEDRIDSVSSDAPVRWQMPTFASVSAEGAVAVLRQDGKEIEVRCLEPAGAQWRIEDASRPPRPFDQPNPGLKLLVVEVPARTGDSPRITVELKPRGAQDGGGASGAKPPGRELIDGQTGSRLPAAGGVLASE